MKLMGKLKDEVKGAAHETHKLVAKPTTKDEEFEELRQKFDKSQKQVENMKKEVSKMVDNSKSFCKPMLGFGEELENFHGSTGGSRYKKTAVDTDAAFQEFTKIGSEVVAGLAQIVANWDGLKKKNKKRDDLLLEMDLAFKDKEKATKDVAKAESKYEHAKEEYDGFNSKLKEELAEALSSVGPEFEKLFKKLAQAQSSMFHTASKASEDL